MYKGILDTPKSRLFLARLNTATNKVQISYNGGYIMGYEWLNRQVNDNPLGFKHPSVPGGYIPGGSREWIHYDFRRGFKQGIDDYVIEHNLSYPMISVKDDCGTEIPTSTDFLRSDRYRR